MRRPLRIVAHVVLTGLALGVPRLEGRSRRRRRHPPRRESVVVRALGRDHDRHRPPDGAPLAVADARRRAWTTHFAWLTRAYFVSYTASQVLPTSIGGDAMRVYETARRHPGRTGDVTAIILLERGLGGAGTVLLGAIGFLLALGTTTSAPISGSRGRSCSGRSSSSSSSSRARRGRCSTALRPLLARLRVERPLRALYDGVHHFRGHAGLLLGVFLFTTAIQAVRILSIWAAVRRWGSSSARGSTT